MSTIKAVDKLREALANCITEAGHTDKFDTYWIVKDAADKLIGEIEDEIEETKAFCERIERAANAREELEVFGVAYMPLPLDAWGEPIRTDDLMACTAFEPNDFDGKRQVLAVSYGLWVDRDGFEHLASETRHAKHRTLEDVLFGFGEEFEGEMDEIAPIIAKYAEEIRELLGVME